MVNTEDRKRIYWEIERYILSEYREKARNDLNEFTIHELEWILSVCQDFQKRDIAPLFLVNAKRTDGGNVSVKFLNPETQENAGIDYLTFNRSIKPAVE
jgi:hypothetical protein